MPPYTLCNPPSPYITRSLHRPERGRLEGKKMTPHEISYLLREYEYTQGGRKTSTRPTDAHVDPYNFFPHMKEIEPRDTIIRTSFIFHSID